MHLMPSMRERVQELARQRLTNKGIALRLGLRVDDVVRLRRKESFPRKVLV